MRPRAKSHPLLTPLQRIRIWYALLLILGGVFIVRLFYLQVIRHDYYQKAALQGQLRGYEIPAKRGIIDVHSGQGVVPLVLNEIRYTLFADPKMVTDVDLAAESLQTIIGGKVEDYAEKMRLDTRYSVLAKKLPVDQKEKIAKLKLKGIHLRETPVRTYPQGSLAAQLLGFVDDEGNGKYGLEQALNDELKGQTGLFKAITDAQGVPLASNHDNILIEPEEGQRVLLTIDIGMQQGLEDILKAGLEAAKSSSGSALIIEADTGAIKAMANFPTFNPAEFFKIEDANVFNNAVVSAPLEVGSVMKPLTAAAALDLGVVSKNSSYFDPGLWRLDGATVTNIEEVGGAANRSLTDILQLSLNTGATWLLMQMGGGEVNEQARVRWHDYMVNHYQFGKVTGIEQGYEEGGSIPDPREGFGLNIQYANTAFGQGLRLSPLQLGAALASVINGGTYYRPHLVEQLTHDGQTTVKQPEVIRGSVVQPAVGQTIRELMEFVVEKNNRPAYRAGYSVGGKTGTAQVPKPEGGYYEDRYNGMYLGFVGGNQPQYVIVVRVNEPRIAGYAGAQAAGPIFANLTNMLIDSFGVTPKN